MSNWKWALATLAPFAVADISQCPSSTCWTWDDTNNVCVLADGATCGYAIACAPEGMTITFPHALFGSDDSSDFENPTGTNDNTCDPVFTSGNGWSWSKALGTCGQTIVRESDSIKIRKVLNLGASADPGLSVTDTAGNAASIFVSTDGGNVQVTFTCVFDAQLSVTSEDLTVNPLVAVEGTAVESLGNWGDSLQLKYYQTNAFQNELDANGRSVFIGATMFVQSEWSVTTMGGILEYYIDTCTVTDKSTNIAVEIVKTTCYSATVGAEPLGAAAANDATGKIVQQFSQFQYTSFSFDTSASDDQELSCLVKFCVIDPSSGNSDCTDIVPRDGSGSNTCPTTAGFSYAA